MKKTKHKPFLKMSRFLFACLFILAVSSNVNAQNKITVQIEKVTPAQGSIFVALFDSESTFLTSKRFKSEKVQVDSNSVLVVFDSIPNGTYAISTFHDENSNGKMDKGMFGIPEEGYGFSNNARGMFGPAKFKDAKFEIKDEDVFQKLKH